MNNNLLIVSMGLPYNYSINNSFITIATAPYGPLSIASYINEYTKTNARVSVLDLCKYNFNENQCLAEILKSIEQNRVNILGFSLMFNTSQVYMNFLTSEIKKIYPNMFIVAGGPVASNFYETLLDDIPNLDAICYSEGEKPIFNIMESEDILTSVHNEQALVTRKSLKEGRKPQANFVYNLDEIPFIDYSLIDLDDYGFTTNSPVEIANKPYDSARELWIHTARGCPFSCVFCAAHSVHGKKMRYMSAERVVSNVKDMIDRFGMTHLSVVDDQFLLDKQRAKDILKGLSEIRPGLTIFFYNLSVALIDAEMAALMKQLNCPRVVLAIESGSQFVLDHVMHKPVKLEHAKEVINILKANDLYVESLFVIGLPGETDSHREETLSFIRSTAIDWSKFFVAAPIKGSELYDICLENGYICNSDAMNADFFNAAINTPDYSAEYITKKAYLMNLDVNFVNNNKYLMGNYEEALKKFNKVVTNYPEHAIGHYCLARVHQKLGNLTLLKHHLNRFKEIYDADVLWQEYSNHLCIGVSDFDN